MGSDVLAIIPARMGSKGVPGKNWKLLAGGSPLERAWRCALEYGLTPEQIVISTDAPCPNVNDDRAVESYLWRSPQLAQDDTPMIDVVKHALWCVPGPPEQMIVLLQCTQPLRTPDHIRQAIALLESGADSVVSVVQLPLTHHPDATLELRDGHLWPFRWWCECGSEDWSTLRTRRQDYEPAYIRDGTCYAFRRSTVTRYGTIYGQDVRPLIIPPEQTCALDSESDWLEAERRLRER